MNTIFGTALVLSRNITLYLLLFVILLGCSNDEKRVVCIDVDDPVNTYFVIKNTGKNNAYFTFDINGRGMYNIDKMVTFIDNNYENMPQAEKVWHFISEYSSHNELITKNDWLYNPLVLINSAGGSLCGFQSAAMTNILLHMGEKARSWCVNGHVVTEVKVNNRWQVYDPAQGVIYYNDKGDICSFFELCTNSVYISNPVKAKSIANACDSLWATTQELADKYASLEDNSLFSTSFDENNRICNAPFMLPAGSSLKFVFPDDSNETTFALAWLEIPAFWNGEIAIPLILYDVSSNNAEVYFQHENVINNRGLLTNKIADSKEFDSKLVIKNNKSGVRIRYYINPKLYAPEKNNTVTIWGTIKGVTITTEKYSHGEKQDWRYICDDHYIQLVTNITSCFQQKTLNIASLDDYLENVEFVLGCDAVKQFNYDETLIRSLIDKKVRQVKNSDTIFWQRFSDINEFSKSLSDIIYESQKYDKF